MKDLIEFIIRSLVDNHEGVSVIEEEADDGTLQVRLTAEPRDMGRIIARQGRTAKAMRTLLNARSCRANPRVNLQILQE